LLIQQILTVLSAGLLKRSFRTADNSSAVSDHQPLSGSRQRRLAVHPVNVVARRDPGDVEPVNRRRGDGRGEIDWDVSAGGSSSHGAVSSSSELDHQLLPIKIHGALNIQSELGVLPSHHVQKTILLDIDSSSDCSRRCGGGVSHKLSVDLQEVSKNAGGSLAVDWYLA